MKPFALQLLQSFECETLHQIGLLEATDASGRFALQAGHAHFVTVLQSGLVTLRYCDGRTEYMATTGGVLSFSDNKASLHARRCWRGDLAEALIKAMDEDMASVDRSLQTVKTNLRQFEDNVMQRLLQLEKHR